MPVNSSNLESGLNLKTTKAKGARSMAQVVEHLPSKSETLRSIFSVLSKKKKKKKKRKKERKKINTD
jgi:hypothetical protein